MKKVFLLVLVLVLGTMSYAQTKIQFRSTDKAECVKSDYTSLKASFSFSGLDAQKVETQRGSFSELVMPNTVIGGNEGDPQIPVVNQLIAVPFGAEPTIRVTSYSTTDYKLSDFDIDRIVPRQPSLRKDKKAEEVPFVYNEEAYQTRGLHSEPTAVVQVVGTMRGVRLGKMTIEPVSYDPVGNTLRVFNDIEVEVSFDGADAAATEKMLVDTYSPYFDIVYKQLFNGRAVLDAYSAHPDLYSTPVKMLVVATSDYTSSTAFQNWLNWKKQKGIDVDIYTVTSSTASSTIQSEIQSRYNSNHPTFLVIVGDETVVKAYKTNWSCGSTYGNCINDLEYASFDGDVYHDIYMSRMSVSSTTELGYLVNKILTYEKYTMSDPSYLTNSLLVAGWDSSWTNKVGKPTIQYANNNYYNSAHGINPTVYITTASGQTAAYNNINNVGFLNYTAHGDIQKLADPLFNNSSVSSMTNNDKYLWIVANCCLTANWGNSSYSPCFGEAMIRAQNKGAFGYIGSIPESYWYEDYYFGVGAFSYVASTVQTTSSTTTGMYDAAFDDTGFNTLNSMPYIGNVAVTYAHAANYTSSVEDEYYWRAYQCLGDGSVMPYLKEPAANNVTHANSLNIGATSFTVTADAGSYVAITVNNEIIGVKVVPSNGTVDVPITAQSTTGNAMIVVTRNQRQPYITTIPIVGGTQYSITCTQPQHGTISAPAQAYGGAQVTLTATPDEGYCLSSWTVKAGNTNITVTDNTFTMPESNVTVTATFAKGNNVTLAQTSYGTISANPTCALQGTTINLTATPNAGFVFDSWVVYKTDDINTTVNVSNNQFTMPAYDVTVVGFFDAPQGGEMTIGSTVDTLRGWTLPTHVYYGNSLTQQIYTAAEVNGAGTITSISFYYLGSSNSTSGSASSSGARTFDIYMSNTTSSNLNSWVNESASHIVYTGTQTFNAVGWYTFTLDTPFEYDGTSNLLLTFNDRTGSYDVSSRRYFRTYSTGENRSRYVCYDNSSFDPTAATSISTGSYNVTTTANNIIKLTKETQSVDGSLIVTPTVLTGFTYAEGQGPATAQSVNVIGANLGSNVTVTAPADYEVCLTSGGTYASSLTLTPSNGSVRTMVYVRLKAGLAQGNYNNKTLTFTSSTVSQTVTLSGEVTQGDGVYYAITVEANPEYGGTVTGGSTYKEGTTATLTATANAGYTFQNWTKNGSVVSTSATYSFTVTAAGDYVANFTRNSYTIQASANPAAGGTVSGAGMFYEGTTITLTATANEGYAFVNWTKNNTVVSTEPSYTFVVNAGGAYVANFTELTSYTITLATVENGTISADKNTAYPGDVVTLTQTPATGYFFSGWNVKDANNQTVTVTDNTFVMPSSNVTVSASFAQGYVITLADVTNGSISADKTNALPGETITLSATPDNDHFLSAWLVFKTGDVKYTLTVTNNQFTMPSFDVTVFAIFKANETEEVAVGSGTSTNSYIPTYAYYKYSFTEQIYTAEEIGSAGNITAIAFKVSNSKSATRTLDVYMKQTTRTAFSSRTDWESFTTSEKVFSGSVAFASSGWTTITLNTPFEYDGESNLIIAVDDNTGSYVSGSSNSPQFYVYSTGANRAIRVYNDSTNPNPTSPGSNSYSSSYNAVQTSNNQITFTISHPSSGASLTVSPLNQSGFTYEEGNGPSEVRSIAVIGIDLSDDITVTAPEDFEISDAANGSFGNVVTLSASSKGNREAVTYDFEDGWQNWTAIKGTSGTSSHNWMHNTEYVAYDSNGNQIAPECYNSSTGMMLSESYISASTSGGEDATAVYPDNYLVSPQFELGGSITFYAASRMSEYPAEKFSVLVSESGNTSVSDFTHTELTVTLSDNSWNLYTVDLSNYSGMGYVAIRHYDCYDQHLLYIDDVTITGPNDTPVDPTTPTVEMLTANVYARLKAGLAAGSYANEVLTATTGEISSNVTLNGEVTPSNIIRYTVTLNANPAEGGTVTGGGSYPDQATVRVTATANTGYTFINWTENGQEVSTYEEFVFTSDRDKTLVANFQLNSYEVTATANPSNGGTIEGAGTYNHGATATLTATAANGYTFTGWTVNGNQVSTNATYSFAVNEAATLVANFELLPVEQDITFISGWNWWSTYIDITLEQLEDAIGTYGISINNAALGSVVYNENYQAWAGDFTTIDPARMYQIETNSDDALELSGQPLDPADYPITINAGTNWIGYPVQNTMTLNQALVNHTPTRGDVIKSKTKTSVFTTKWSGSFTLEPGRGYIYISKVNAPSFVYPNGEGNASKFTDDNITYWTAQRARFANNMSVIAALELDGTISEDIEVGAFVNGECRDAVKLTYIDDLGQYLAILTVSGNNGETVSFKAYENGNVIDLDETVTIHIDDIVGDVDRPFVLHAAGDALTLFPNPAAKGETIHMELTANVDLNGATVEIYNALGAKVRMETLSNNHGELTGLQTPGIYTVKVSDSKGNVHIGKLVVR